MKNRKTIIVAFVLVACMLIGVGYAALSTRLDITGNVNVSKESIDNQFAEDVYFCAGSFVAEGDSKFDVTSGLATQDQINPTTGGKTASAYFTSNNLAAKGDYVIAKFTIANESDFDVAVTIAATKANGNANMSNTNPGQFKFEVRYGATGNWYELAAVQAESLTILKSTGSGIPTGDVYVKATVIDEVNSATNAIFGVELTASEIVPTP